MIARHESRHESRDASAGGPGLGVLETKRKHIRRKAQLPSPDLQGLRHNDWSPDLEAGEPGHGDPGALSIVDDNSLMATGSRDLGVPEVPTIHSGPYMQIPDTSPGWYDLVNTYYDPAFDSVHFGVNTFRNIDPVLETPWVGEVEINSADDQSTTYDRAQRNGELERLVSNEETIHQSVERTDQTWIQEQRNDNEAPEASRDSSVCDAVGVDDVLSAEYRDGHALPKAKWKEVLAFIRSHQSDSESTNLSTVDEHVENLDQTSMQLHLDCFFRYFNTTYPLIHLPTISISGTKPILLFAMTILGATYHSKRAHRTSVYLYDVVVPSIMVELLQKPPTELSTLQAFSILECYGMYRAGPHQRESAILIHGLLLSVSSPSMVLPSVADRRRQYVKFPATTFALASRYLHSSEAAI